MPAANKIYDIAGIGIGPFNLGMAALCHSIPKLDCLFIEKNNEFNWHPGMMIPGTKLQVPFYADLVTLADPCSRFSFMNYLKAHAKMFRFGIREDFYIKRSTYNDYCRWVAAQLPSLRFNCKCEAVHYNESSKFYEVKTSNGTYHAKNLVIGIGSVPFMPSFAENLQHPLLLHSAKYLYRKQELLKQKRITIIGSGQSAAEILYDLMQTYQGELYWFTRSARFFPMDYSKLTLEMSTPDYIAHFYSLPENIRREVSRQQDGLYKGINHSLIEAIYAALDDNRSGNIHLHTNCELTGIEGEFNLQFQHRELQKEFIHASSAVILATGYKTAKPDFLHPVRHLLSKKTNCNYSIDRNNTIFVQNGEQATHGFNAADLSLGPYRNAVILNTISGKEIYPVETGITFQTFGLPNP